MDEQTWLARQFEDERPHLRAVAYRMLGSLSEADDALQDAWLRLSRADTRGQPTTVARGARHATLADTASRPADGLRG